ncbi:SMI1/KNR4 family protein [Streptomyces olivoreticuli]
MQNHEEFRHPGLEALRTLMPPHEGAGDGVDWADAEREWGTRFPHDYMAFMSEYGEGGISDFLQVLQPFSTAYDKSVHGMHFETENARGFVTEVTGPDDLRASSTAPLIAWGVTSGPDIPCRQTTDDDPERWPVVVIGRHTSSSVTRYNVGMTEFLKRVILTDFEERPLSGLDLWGAESPKFLHRQEEKRLWNSGIDPWTGEADPHAGREWD